MEFLNSEHILYQKNADSDKLVIFFTDAAARNFAGYKLFQKFNVSRLFIKDNTRNWYNGPINGLSENINHLAENISQICKEYDSKNIYCIGGSMGAYAAVVIGCLIGAQNVLAFSPQMILDSRFPNNPKNEHILTVKNAYDLVKTSDKTKVDILCGSEDLIDLFNAYPASQLENATFTCLYGAPHNTMGFLKKIGILDAFLMQYLNDSSFNTLPLPIYNINLNEHEYKMLSEAIDKYYSNKIKDALRDFINLSKIITSWSPLLTYIANCLLKLGQHQEALEYINKALIINPLNDSYHITKGTILINLKKYNEAEEAFITAKNVALSPLDMHDIKLGSIKTLKGEYKEARSILLNVYKSNDKNMMVIYQLGILAMKEGSYSEAVDYFSMNIELGDKNPNTLKHLCFTATHVVYDYINKKDFSNAEKTATRLLNYGVTDENTLRTIASTKVFVGKYDEALRIIKKLQGSNNL